MIKNKNLLNEGYENKFRVKSGKDQYIFLKNGKKLIDTSFCSGTLLLGHSKNFLNNSFIKQLKKGVAYGLPNTNADKYSLFLKKIFGNYSKFILCNTGSEANNKAIRLARSITKKEYIVMTSGSWHGSVDQLLFDLSSNNYLDKRELSAGLTKDLNKKIILVPYNDYEKSITILKKFKSKIAMVIIEPIQQALPSKKCEDYIKNIYNFCKSKNILICFDEMITGIRVDKFSVQKSLKLKPDLSTFGKIIGGGLPIGAIGLSKTVERKLSKQKNKVFFGGTFSGNPLVTEIGYQNLKYIYKNKKKIFDYLENLSDYFEKSLNLFLKKKKLNLKVIRYYSILRIIYTKNIIKNKFDRQNKEENLSKKINQFQNFAANNGVYLSKRGAIFFSYSYTKKDVKYLIDIISKGLFKFFR